VTRIPERVAPGEEAGPGTGPTPVAEIRGGRLRAGCRLAGIAAWTAASFGAWALGTGFTLLVPRARLRWRHRTVRAWARGVGRLLGMRASVIGTPPRAPFFLVSNHLSYVDIVLLHGLLDGVFIAKRDMRHWPVLGPLAQLVGTIWVTREVRRDAVRVLDEIDEAIARGDGVILFPEGTTSAGDGLLPMKPALLDWAAREQFPVHYAAITYTTDAGCAPAHLAVGWWGDMTFGAHAVNLCRLAGFRATVVFGPEPITAPTRGELARQVQQAIAERFVPWSALERKAP
jgi:1-acyl-sn-glycerol-3-phosphate acyltransferase